MVSQEFYKALLDNLSEGVYFVDRDRRISYWNKAAEDLTGRRADEVVGFCCSDNILVHTDDAGTRLCLTGCPLNAAIADGKFHEASVYLLHKDGHRVPVSVRVIPLRNQAGDITGAVETFSDNSSNIRMKEQIAQLETMSLIDEMTKVGNRRYANITLETRLSEFKRHSWPFGMIMIDIDNFKRVNDVFGHNIGDEVLRMVARTISGNMRSAGSMFFRWGGEEFIILASNVTSLQLFELSERMRILVATSALKKGELEISVTVSAGAAIANPEDDADSLVRRADELMYRSKKEGRNRTTADFTPAGLSI